MSFSRYNRSPKLDLGAQYGTSRAAEAIRAAIKGNKIHFKIIVVRGAERLDTLAGSIYGDARYWWVLAAASNIGWGLQIPAGTMINVPELGAISQIVA